MDANRHVHWVGQSDRRIWLELYRRRAVYVKIAGRIQVYLNLSIAQIKKRIIFVVHTPRQKRKDLHEILPGSQEKVNTESHAK